MPAGQPGIPEDLLAQGAGGVFGLHEAALLEDGDDVVYEVHEGPGGDRVD